NYLRQIFAHPFRSQRFGGRLVFQLIRTPSLKVNFRIVTGDTGDFLEGVFLADLSSKRDCWTIRIAFWGGIGGADLLEVVADDCKTRHGVHLSCCGDRAQLRDRPGTRADESEGTKSDPSNGHKRARTAENCDALRKATAHLN